MPRSRPNGGEGATGRERADVLGDAFRNVTEGLVRMQEALRLQGQEAMRRQEEAERRHQEALRLQEQRAAAALHEAVGQMEAKLQEKDDAIRALEQRLEGPQQSVTVVRGRPLVSGDEGALMRLEGRMQRVEASLQRTMQKFFPRVDGLLRHLEEMPAPGRESSSFSSSTSAGRSHAVSTTQVGTARGREEHPTPLTPRVSTPTSVASSTLSSGAASAIRAPVSQQAAGGRRGAPGAGQGSGALDERQRVERRIRKVTQRIIAARATPCQLGERLLLAVRNIHLEEIQRLLDAGADVNYINRHGIFPLKRALEMPQSDDMIALLLQRGADPNVVNDRGTSAMHEATWHDHSRYVDLVIAAGGDVNARDWLGRTPLHWAADKSNAAAVRALLSAGARKDIRGWGDNYVCKTPFAIAKASEIKDLLRP